ncbi:uncharacterized protein [Medicago truncatula]|uniref:uncharacterized protein n=1 Tax=Medicago truncatula TaxID=3880 RepID=UPI001966FB17|nr:uncharacterized protein LOC120579928 [Medicago truncatula]
MAGRNDAANAAALEAVAQAVQQQPHAGAASELEQETIQHGVTLLSQALKNKQASGATSSDPSTKAPEAPQSEPLSSELRMAGRNDVAIATALEVVTQDVGHQPNANAGANAEFYPHYTAEIAEFSKCIKFENGLRAEIKRAIGYQKIRTFSELVSSCRIYVEDTKDHYKIVNERKSKGQPSRPKPYSAPADKGKQRVNDERRPRKKDAPVEIMCYTCGEKGHKSNACPGDVKRCFRCGKKGHTLVECKHDDVVCFNCNEEGHIGSQCKKPEKAPTTGRVFALTGT